MHCYEIVCISDAKFTESDAPGTWKGLKVINLSTVTGPLTGPTEEQVRVPVTTAIY